jgi:hypothetical protein
MLFACAHSNPKDVTAAAPDIHAAPDSGFADADGVAAPGTALADAEPEAHAAAAADARPFANNPVEATSMINDAVDSRAAALIKCVEVARVRRKNAHGKIAVEIGIDQEGSLIGVKSPKGQPKDDAFNDCVRESLARANFPRSHAGVITVKRSFEDQAVTR